MVGGHPVQIGARYLQDRNAQIGCPTYRFSEPLVGFGAQCNVERGRRDTGAQAFDHRVASEYRLAFVGAFGRPTLLRLGAFGGGMVRAHMRRRCGAASLERAATLAPGAHGRALLGPVLADRPLTPRIAGHYLSSPANSSHCGPSAVSVTSMPAILSRSRISSARAQFRCSRAS